MVRNVFTTACKCTFYLLAGLVILIALFAASVRLAVLYSEDYSERLSALVSSYVGSPVEIGEVDLVWNRFDASASLSDVQIQSADGSETMLTLPKIELQLNVRDMVLKRNLNVRSVQLNNLSLVADVEGGGEALMLRNVIRGDFASDGQGASGYNVLSWLLNTDRIAILDSDITLIDRALDREYKIDNVNIRAFNDGDLHQLRIDSSLPGSIGETSLASLDFNGRADDISAWKGQFYVNAKGLNLSQLSGFLGEKSQQYTGFTDIQMWGQWSESQLKKVRAIANGRDIEIAQSAASGTGDTRLSLRNVDMDVDLLASDNGYQANFSRLTAALNNEELQLDGLDVHIEDDTEGGKSFRVTGPDFDLASLQPVFSYVDAILPVDVKAKTSSLRSGRFRNWLVGGTLASQDREGKKVGSNSLSEVNVDIDDLAIDASASLPGISGLSAAVRFGNGTGQATIANQDINLDLPGLYENPLPLINADGVLRFLINDDQWKVVSEDFRLSSLDLNTSVVFSVLGNPEGQRLIDLHAKIINANLANINHYYPTKVMKPKLLSWLQASIVDGDLVRGRFELKGDLTDFSPAQGRGHLYAESDIVNATLKFKEDWPAAEAMDGNLSLTAGALRGRVYKGRLRQAQFSDARVFIPDFTAPVLALQTNAIGPVADMLDFAQRGPLAPKIGPAFGDATGSGTSRLALDLQIPLTSKLSERLSVDGAVVLDNAQLQSRDYGVDLDSASGKVGFNKRGIVVDDLQVRYQGLPLDVTASQQLLSGADVNRLSVRGPVAPASVLKSYDIPLEDFFEGVSVWNLDIVISRRGEGEKVQVELNASSDLSGTEIKFPVPLYKSTDNLHEAKLYRDFSSEEKDWWIEMPGLVKTRVRVGEDNKVESMAIALGRSNNTVLPWRGIALHGDAQRVDALGWVQFALGFRKGSDESEPGFPLFAKVNARQMVIGDKQLDKFVYIAYRDGIHQVHRVENRLVSGEMMQRFEPGSEDPLVFRLDKLNKQLLVAIGEADRPSFGNTGSGNANSGITGEVTDRPFDPRELPAFDINVKELQWENWRLERVDIRTRPSDRGMDLIALTARQDSLRVSGGGRWVYDGLDSHVTSLDLNASFDNFGKTIRAIGGGKSFAEGVGEGGLSLSWPGPAYIPDLQSMTGQMLLNLRNGRILSVDPGVGKILGLFALQTLPRRLALDFRDITKTGLEYTSVNGNFSIVGGKAITNAMLMSGPVAEVLVHGSTDFFNRTYNQTIDVLPRVNGALPILGVLASGPAAAVTALLADGILRGLGVDFNEVGRRRLKLVGTWDNPQWRTVDLSANVDNVELDGN